MNTQLYLAFLFAVVALVLLPGPTVMLVTSKSLRNGMSSGLVAVAGSALAGVIHLTIVVTGLASVVLFVGDWFEWIRWFGVAYLLYLGIRTWSDASVGSADNRGAGPASVRRDFSDGFLVTLTNPKALLFHGAFLPQFVDPALPALPQLLILAFSFLIVATFLDSCWVLLAARVRKLLATGRSHRLIARLSGSLLIGASATLALIRRSG
jgi:threonine/homoserine/homoserine lactone efflux protein